MANIFEYVGIRSTNIDAMVSHTTMVWKGEREFSSNATYLGKSRESGKISIPDPEPRETR